MAQDYLQTHISFNVDDFSKEEINVLKEHYILVKENNKYNITTERDSPIGDLEDLFEKFKLNKDVRFEIISAYPDTGASVSAGTFTINEWLKDKENIISYPNYSEAAVIMATECFELINNTLDKAKIIYSKVQAEHKKETPNERFERLIYSPYPGQLKELLNDNNYKPAESILLNKVILNPVLTDSKKVEILTTLNFENPIQVITENNKQLINNNPKNNKMEEKKEENKMKYNQQYVRGTLVGAPEFGVSEKNGKEFATFSVARNFEIKGEKKVEFHNCMVPSTEVKKLKDLNLEKGAKVEVQGKASFNTHENNKYNTLIAFEFNKMEAGQTPLHEKDNYFEFTGNIATEPKYTKHESGLIANFSLGHNFKINKEGDKAVMYSNVSVFGKAAEILQDKKIVIGSSVSVAGSLNSKSYEDKEKNKKHTIQVSANYAKVNPSKEKVVDNEVTQEQAETVEIAKEQTTEKKKSMSK